MKKVVVIIGLGIILSFASLAAQSVIPDGTLVFAEWAENSWYHGKVTGTCSSGYSILYDDNETDCCTLNEIVIDAVPSLKDLQKGMMILAEWSNGMFYPAVLGSVQNGKYKIDYDDGDTGIATIEQIRIRTVSAEYIAAAQESEDSSFSSINVEAITTQVLYIYQDGSMWAEISESGEIWINGSFIGEIESDGDIYHNGSRVGEVETNGKFWMSGSKVGELETNGKLWRGGSKIAEFNSSADIYLGGYIWGELYPYGGEFKDLRAAAAVLVFFSPDFGFLEN